MRRSLLLLLVLYFSRYGYSQMAFFTTADDIRRNTNRAEGIDSFDRLFFVYNPAFLKYTFYNDLGNINTASQPMHYVPEVASGFRTGYEVYNAARFSVVNPVYYFTRRPLSDLYYVQGGKDVTILNAKFITNLRPHWNIGVDYNRNKSTGYYLAQKTSVYNTRVFNWYRTPDNRYHVFANAVFSRVAAQESGGIVSDSAFENHVGGLIQTDVFFSNTSSYHTRNFYSVEQLVNLGPKKVIISPKDSMSENTDTLKVVDARWTLSHKSEYSSEVYSYYNPNSDTGFYRDFFVNSSMSYDSQIFRKFRNSVKIRSQVLKTDFGLLHETINFKSLFAHGTFNNISAFFRVGEFNLEYFLQGYNQGDFKAVDDRRIPIVKVDSTGGLVIHTKATLQRFKPAFISDFYYGNHYFWDNDFEKTKLGLVTIALEKYFKNKQFVSLWAEASETKNGLYFDTLHRPQLAGKTTIFKTGIDLNIQFRKIHLQNKFIYQKIHEAGNGELPVFYRSPDLAVFSRLFFEGFVLKKTLYLLTGLECTYTSSYYARSYDPVLRQFYNQDKVKIGNYPLFDFFITGHVKTFSIGFKVEHFNQDLTGKRYYSSAHYPLSPRAMRLIIQWRLPD